MHIYMYMYVCVCVCVYICVYIYICIYIYIHIYMRKCLRFLTDFELTTSQFCDTADQPFKQIQWH